MRRSVSRRARARFRTACSSRTGPPTSRVAVRSWVRCPVRWWPPCSPSSTPGGGAGCRVRLEQGRCGHDLHWARTKGAVDQLVRVLGPGARGTGEGHRIIDEGGGAAASRGQAALRRVAESRAARRSDGRHVAAGRPAPRSTAATPTRRHGPRPVSTPPRSGCSPSSTGDCPCGATSARLAGTDEQLSAGRRGRCRSGASCSTAASRPRDAALAKLVEVGAHAQCAVVLDALGDGLDELLAILGPWGDAIRAAGSYPPQGPHDLAPVR